jgi:predicted TIM-barrel fold metal-dependent hydrolase
MRLMPMPIMPAWDIGLCVKEVERMAKLGMRGVNMTTDPQDLGAPDLASRLWDPFWAACEALNMPVHFHIGASITAMNFFGQYFWPSQDEYVKPAIGGSMLFIGNARVLINTVFAGIFDRFPKLRMVSVESGIGWIPFFLQSLDYQQTQSTPGTLGTKFSLTPTEYFKRQMHACFWFEDAGVAEAVAALGDTNVMFETDYPHPTCLYPAPLESVANKMSVLRPETRRRVMGENAARLYRL